MSTVISLLLLLVFLAGGFVAAKLKWLSFNAVTERAFSVALYLLLFSMGLKLGQSKDVLANLSLVGTLAVCGTLFACAGTLIAHLAMTPVYRRLDRLSSRNAGDAARDDAHNPAVRLTGSRRFAMLLVNLKKPLILLVLVVIGTVVGSLIPQITIIRDGTISNWLLYFLLFIIGIQMAETGTSIVNLLLQPSVLLVPLVTIVGTLVGSLGTLLFHGMTVGKALALGSGFGWYSLSGVLISNLGDPMLGAAAFLSNLFRETIAFLTIPVLRVTGRCESGIGIAGATSMDVTLPVVEDTWGAKTIPLSVAHGVILSFLVPFLVPLFMSL